MGKFAVRAALLLSIMSAPLSAAAKEATKQDLLVFHLPIHYSGTILKSRTVVDGLYYYYGVGSDHSIEAEYDRTRLRYVSGQNYRQRDFTVAYSQYRPAGKTRVGAHSIKSSTLTDNDITLFFGSARYKPNGKAAQADIYMSSYSKYSPRVKVYQITPALSRTTKTGDGGIQFLQTRVYLIHLAKSPRSMLKNYYSAEQTYSYTRGNVTLGVTAWAGKQAFAVRKDGFAVFNTAETHKGGYELSFSYALPNRMKATLTHAKEKFSDFGAVNSANSKQTGLSLFRTF